MIDAAIDSLFCNDVIRSASCSLCRSSPTLTTLILIPHSNGLISNPYVGLEHVKLAFNAGYYAENKVQGSSSFLFPSTICKTTLSTTMECEEKKIHTPCSALSYPLPTLFSFPSASPSYQLPYQFAHSALAAQLFHIIIRHKRRT